MSFPTTVSSQLLFGLNITIDNNLPYGSQVYIASSDVAPFRFLTCLFMGLVFGLALNDCTCFPQSTNELMATDAGIGLNCVKLACRNQLKQNPLLFDDLIHTDCTDTNFNTAFVSLGLFAGQTININNFTITQSTNDSSTTTSPPPSSSVVKWPLFCLLQWPPPPLELEFKFKFGLILASFNTSLGQLQGATRVAMANMLKQLTALEQAPDDARVGSILFFSGDAQVPANYMVCNGSTLSKDAFATLYSVIKTLYTDKENAPPGFFAYPT